MTRDLKVARALQLCRVGLPSLDFAGSMSSLVGANATKAGIPYTCLVQSGLPYFNAYVPLGSMGLGHAVLSCIDWRPARFFIGAGEVGSMLELCGLKASGKVNYVGLQSLTALPVRGVVGEAVVLELFKKEKMKVEKKERAGETDHLHGRNAGRPTLVVWATINKPDEIGGELHVVGEEGALFGYVATILNIIILTLMATCHEWFGFALVASGMVLNVTMAYVLRFQKFTLPEANPAKGVPPGDAVIRLDDDPDMFFVLRGTEKAIQTLLQKEVKLDAGRVEHWPLFLVSVACYMFSAVVMLGVPHMKSYAQVLWVIVVCVGAMTDLTKGSFDCKRGIANVAIDECNIEIDAVKKFQNRTASVASVAAGKTKLDTLRAAELLPTAGTVWQNWWTALGYKLDDKAIENSELHEDSELENKMNKLTLTVREEDKELWENLQDDMDVGLRQGRTVRDTLKSRRSVGNISRNGHANAPLQSADSAQT